MLLLFVDPKPPYRSPASSRWRLLVPARRNVLLSAACLSYATFSVVYMSAIRALPSSVAALIFYTYPLLVVALTPLLEAR